MSKPVEVRFIWSKEAALKGSKLYYDWDMKHSSKRYVGWFFVALVQFAIVGALKHHVFGLLYLSTFLLIYWYYIRWYIRKRMIVRYYDQSRIEEKEVLFTLTDEGLSYEDMMADWDHIFKAIKFDDGILLQTLNYTLFFEKDAFKSPKEMDRFVEMMKQHGKLI